MALETKFYDLEIPSELIAQSPNKSRSGSRLMVVDPEIGQITDTSFSNVTQFLSKDDLLVLNDTKVINARFFGEKSSGAKIEFLYLNSPEPNEHMVLVKPARKLKIGDTVSLQEGRQAVVINDFTEGRKLIKFESAYPDESCAEPIMEYLEKYGLTPTPPYIKEVIIEPERYQTVYAKSYGSAAAPTAGLHFDEDTFSLISAMGISIAHVTLNVGLGTFKPIDTELIDDFKIHEEIYEISEGSAELINKAIKDGKRIVCVGTTSLRALESAFENGIIRSGQRQTSLFIKPGYKFKAAGALLTNFHFPRTTLFVLVCTFAGPDLMKTAYAKAIEDRYRMLSFGDAMFITSVSNNKIISEEITKA